jgi:hypothetical protein
LFYLFGGEYNNVADVKSFTRIWSFDVVYNKWNSTTSSDGSHDGIGWPAFGAGAVADAGTAFYYGGYLNNKTTPKWTSKALMLSSLITFDMNTQVWSNRTLDNTPRAEGILHYIPASQDGTLVCFGGLETGATGEVKYVSSNGAHNWAAGLLG